MLDRGDGFHVAPTTLTAAADRGVTLALDVLDARDGFAQGTDPADPSMGEVSAGPGWSSFCGAWGLAIGRLGHSMETFAHNTEAAAVRYEDADMRAMPAAPPVIPSPEDLDEAWEEACQPGLFGEIPEGCLLA